MLRRWFALLVPTLVSTGVATADSSGGWSYSPPPGYRAEQRSDHVEWTRLGPRSFCSIAIFDLRPLQASAAAETAYEWHNVVTPTFTPKVTRRATLETTNGTAVAATTATLTTEDGTRYAGIHFVVTPPGMIGSVLLTSSSHAALRACERVATTVVRSLDVDWSSPTLVDVEARVESPQGRWAISGPTSREYTFAANGSYRFHSETATNDRNRVVDETGTYTMRGNQLTLAPRVATATTINAGVAKSTNLSLEKATYTWSKLYVPETNEWRLVLTSRKATARDGQLPAGGYSYSNRDAPLWRVSPPAPAI